MSEKKNLQENKMFTINIILTDYFSIFFKSLLSSSLLAWKSHSKVDAKSGVKIPTFWVVFFVDSRSQSWPRQGFKKTWGGEGFAGSVFKKNLIQSILASSGFQKTWRGLELPGQVLQHPNLTQQKIFWQTLGKPPAAKILA
jgi:hypothetical protein